MIAGNFWGADAEVMDVPEALAPLLPAAVVGGEAETYPWAT